ncbi:MAG: multidrug effflux MFS transporter [Pseudomonadota bacterium]
MRAERPPATISSADQAPARGEFVVLIASLMALNALAIDIMLPALNNIGQDFALATDNDQQLVIIAYVFGFGAPQLIYGPLTDRFGRKPILYVSLIGYMLCAFACTAVTTFSALLAVRFTMGVFASGCRVVAVSVVRDLYVGRGMAEIMSLVMTIFMAVPILAPAVGQVVLFAGPWRLIFYVLVVYAGLVLIWSALRLPESLPAEARAPLNLKTTIAAYRDVVTTRASFGYLLASGVVFGSLFGFISAAEQIMREVFLQGDRFVIWFAVIAGGLAMANFTNSRLVQRFGMRRLSHSALVAFTLLSTAALAVMAAFGPNFALFMPFFIAIFACFGLIGSNFNAIAMEPLGRIAGTGSAAYGFATTTLAASIGGLIGRAYDGSVLPLLAGFAGLGLASLLIVAVTENGRLFGPSSN